MTGSTIIFYLLAAITLVSALLAVTSRRIFRSAIYLLFCLVGIAGIYFWMSYEFVAAVQIVVYVGGITVLIIFSIFLTQQAGELLPKQGPQRYLMSSLAVACAFALTVFEIMKHDFAEANKEVTVSMNMIGSRMLGTGPEGFALPFELVSILLLAAMIGCIVIAIRSRPEKV